MKDYKSFICECNDGAFKFIRECAVNIINGNVLCEVEALVSFDKELRIFCNKAIRAKIRRRTVASTKRIKLLKVTSRPIILYTMTSQDFVFIPKRNYVKQKPKTLEVLDDATINENAKIIFLLQRQQKSSEKGEPDAKIVKKPKWSPLQNKIIERKVLKSLSMMKLWQIEKSKPILRKRYDSDNVPLNEDVFLKIGDTKTSI